MSGDSDDDLPGGAAISEEEARRQAQRARRKDGRARDYSGRQRTDEEKARDYERQKQKREIKRALRRELLGLEPGERVITEEYREKLRQNMAKARAAQTVGPAARKREEDERAATIYAEPVEPQSQRTSSAPAAIGSRIYRRGDEAGVPVTLPPKDAATVVARHSAFVQQQEAARSIVPAASVPAEPQQDRPGMWRNDPRAKWPTWMKMVGFIETMKVPDGPMAGQLIKLADWQIEMIRGVYEPTIINSSGKEVRAIQKAVWSYARKNGKGLALNTPLPTPSGWTIIGDVSTGDTLYDELGNECRVTYVSPDRHIDCYRLTFSNGEEVVADGDHLWPIAFSDRDPWPTRDIHAFLAINTSRQGLPLVSVSGLQQRGAYQGTVTITECVRVKTVPTRCIQVDSPNHLFRFGHTMLPTHNTTLAAALLMCHLIGPVAQWGGQCYSVAYERNQAAIVFKAIASIIRQDLLFPYQFSVTDSAKRVYTPWANSTYQALSAESRSKHGLNPNFVIFDELAQFGRDRSLFDVMETSFGAQDEPLMLTISTQADSDDAILSELIDYGLQVQAGEINDPTFHLTFHTLPDGKDPWNEANWHYANPGLGVMRSLDEMRNYARKARASPSAEGPFLNLYHNRRISHTQTAISKEVWEENAEYYAPEALAGMRCWGGLDLSSRTDLTSLVLVFETDGETGPLAVLPFFWTPKDTLTMRSERDKVPYETWQRQGYLEAPEGTAIDYGYVAKRIAQLNTTFEMALTGFDRWRMDVLKGWFKEINLDIPMEPMGQGFKDASMQIESLEEVLLNRRLAHGGNPVLRYCALGAKITKDPAGGRKFDKAKSNSRIDGLVALAMALRARDIWYARNRIDAEGEKRRSGYLKDQTRDRGLIVL